MRFIQRNQIVDLDKLFNGYYQACINTRSQAKALKTERRFGKLIRSFDLGQDIEQSAIKAESKDGLLTLTVAKLKPAKVKQHKIDIH